MPNTATFAARTDSSTANNASLNLTGDAAIEITFIALDPNGGTGDLILDGFGDGTTDPDTQVLIDGQSHSFSVAFVGTLPSTAKQGAGKVPDQFEGQEVIVIVVEDYPQPGEVTRLAFLPEGDATLAEMDAFGNGAINIRNLQTNPPPRPVCFHTGTLVAVPAGESLIETLVPGDLVLSWDGPVRRVAWMTRSDHRWGPEADPTKPVLIRKGALGPDRPQRDLVVSPLHKLLVLDRDGAERLAPARGLLHFAGIRQMKGRRQAAYVHLLLDAPALLVTSGVASESFHPGPTAMKMLSIAQRHALRVALARLGCNEESYGAPPRPPMTCREATAHARPLAATAMAAAARVQPSA